MLMLQYNGSVDISYESSHCFKHTNQAQSSYFVGFSCCEHHFKMPPRRPLSEGEIAMILSAICFFKSEGEKIGDKRFPVYQKVAECLGISLVSVKRVAAGAKENDGNASPGPRKKQCVRPGRPKIVLDDFTLGLIRRTIHGFYMNKIFPTIKNLHLKLSENMEDFPQISLSTLLKIVKTLGFRFKKLNRKPVLMESVTVAASRHTFLRRMKELREQGFKIFFTDETWCGQNHSMKYGWQENVADALEESFENYNQYRGYIQQVYGWRGGMKTPSGAGKRIIMLHIGSEDGFLEGAELCFVGKKGTGDYHNEMNSAHYQEWFKKVLSLLPQKSAVVIDQAPYHTMIDPLTKNPNMSWLKQEIISWLSSRNIPLPPSVTDYNNLTKAELIVLAKPYFKTPIKKLEQLTEELRPDVKLVWLPVAHCELNPIELIWAYVKGKVAKANMANTIDNGRSMEAVNTLCKEALHSVTAELWKQCIKHAKKIEDHYWEKDQLTEDVPQVEPVIVSMADSSSDSSDYSDSEDEF